MAALAATASAGEAELAPPPIALTYDAPAVCSEAQLRDELEVRLPGARFAPEAAVVAVARIADSPEGYLVELTVIAPGASADRRLFPPIASCAEANEAVAGAIAARLAALPPPPAAPGARPPPIARAPIGRLEFGGGGELVGGETTGLVIEAGYLRARGPWWAGGGLRLQTRSETIEPGPLYPRTAAALDVLGLARACGAIGPIELCGVVGAGMRRLSEGNGFSGSSTWGGFGAIGGRVAVMVPLGRSAAFALWGETLVLAGQPSHASDIGRGAGNLVVAGSLVIAIEPSAPKSPRHP